MVAACGGVRTGRGECTSCRGVGEGGSGQGELKFSGEVNI